jgi:hypothetical protein
MEFEIGQGANGSGTEKTKLLSCALSMVGGLVDDDAPPRLGRRIGTTRGSGVPSSASGRLTDWQSGDSWAIDAVGLRGGIPEEVLRRHEILDSYSQFWWDSAVDLLGDLMEEEKAKLAESQSEKPSRLLRFKHAVVQAKEDIEALHSESEEDVVVVDAAVRRPLHRRSFRLFFLERLGPLPDKSKRQIAKSMVQLGEAEFRSLLREQLVDQSWIDDEALVGPSEPVGVTMAQAGMMTQDFFGGSVRYLGPLREAPHVLYDPGPTKRDLGIRGEYSAAVLHAQSRTVVRMPTPEGSGRRVELAEALNFWLDRFGLAKSAKAEDKGRMGIGLSVSASFGNRPVDLTSVGVGVSQALPVVLLCLLAEPGTLLILEQPELHLHPGLQQALADFLLACARSGRQLLVETHSEHLVNRLRRRITEDDSDATQDLVGLLFAEQREGVTSYRESQVNSFGGLDDDWPDGFLDLGARESQSLLRQSLEKRRDRNRRGSSLS